MSKDVNNIGNRGSVQKVIQDVDLAYRQNKIAFAVQVAKLNTGRVKTPEEMKERFEKLFDLCIKTGNLPSYEGLAVACGIPLRTFYDMRAGNYDGYKEYSQVIADVKSVIAFAESSMATDGKIPSSVWMFRAKNYLGMKDVQQIEAVTNQAGDIPNQSGVELETLPEIPTIEGEAVREARDSEGK